MAFFQFPWRFLILMSFFASFSSGACIWYVTKTVVLPKRYVLLGFGFLVFFIIVVQMKYFQGQEYFQPAPGYFSNTDNIRWNLSQASSEYMPKNFAKPTFQMQLPDKTFMFTEAAGNFFSQNTSVTEAKARVFVRFSTIMHINIAYFPAWHVFINDSEIPIREVTNGMEITAPPGTYIITAKFIPTPIEILANTISVGGMIILILAIMLHTQLLKKMRSLYEKENS